MKKLSLMNAQGALSTVEMKQIMAGSGYTIGCYQCCNSAGCSACVQSFSTALCQSGTLKQC